MNIQQLAFQPSIELEKELKFFAETNDGLKIYSGIKHQNDVINWVGSNPDFVDLKTLVAQFPPPGELLDVGVGWGLSSAYLTIKGFQGDRC